MEKIPASLKHFIIIQDSVQRKGQGSLAERKLPWYCTDFCHRKAPRVHHLGSHAIPATGHRTQSSLFQVKSTCHALVSGSGSLPPDVIFTGVVLSVAVCAIMSTPISSRSTALPLQRSEVECGKMQNIYCTQRCLSHNYITSSGWGKTKFPS